MHVQICLGKIAAFGPVLPGAGPWLASLTTDVVYVIQTMYKWGRAAQECI